LGKAYTYLRSKMSREMLLCCFTALASLILIIATASDAWATNSTCQAGVCLGVNFGMFSYCVTIADQTQCGSFPNSDSWLASCQFFAVVACILAVPTCIYMFLVAMKKQVPLPVAEAKAHTIAAGTLGLVALCSLICFAIFAGKGLDGMNPGWGFALMVVAFIFFAIIAVGYFLTKVRGASVGETDALFQKQ